MSSATVSAEESIETGESRLPASWAQERLWFIDKLEGGSSAYNIPLVARLHGELDRGALERALDEIVRRHDVLRTVFANEGGSPWQHIALGGRFELKTHDLSDHDAPAREAELRAQRASEASTEFDLRRGPLIRGRLLRLSRDEHALLVTMHHIVADGWSLGVFFREFAELYAAYVERRPSALEPVALQYADYALRQREEFQGDVLEEEVRYWCSHLAGAPPQLELPTDRPRPAARSYRGGNVPMILGSRLTADLKALAQRHKMTLFMALLAGWALLLARLSRQDDLVIGTPIANRQRPELEGLIGFFVNTLALRICVRPNASLQDYFAHIRKVALEAYDHQDVPFERVVSVLQPDRNLSRNPIFQVMLALQNAPKGELKLPGLDVTLEDGADEPALFDLFLSLEERDGQIVGSLNYASDLFDRATVGRWTGYFRMLLEDMVRRAGGPVGDLELIPEVERNKILILFNSTDVPYPREKLIHELFEEQVRMTPDAVAVEHEGSRLTYRGLNQRANRLARYLVSQGVGPGQALGICMERSTEMVVGLLGILKAGGAYLPLDPHYPTERLKQMLEDAAPRIVITETKLKAGLPASTARQVALDEQPERITEFSDENFRPPELGLSSENLVYVIYTSGSTGRPKATAMRHRSVVNLVEWHRRTFGPGQGHRVLQFAALSFDVAFQEIFSTLCTGGTLVLLDEWVRRDVKAFTELLERYSIDRLFVPPLMLQSIAERAKSHGQMPATLKDVITAGEQLRVSAEIRAFFRRLSGARLHNHYGPTETHVVTTLTLEEDPGIWPDLPPIGRPIANTQIYVLDARMRPVPIGVAGEIYIGGANVAQGYLNRPELTGQRFVADPFGTDPGARLYKTGDLGRWEVEGTLAYLGRNDDQVKIRGFRIEPGEIEAQLAQHEYVRESAVVAREDVPGERRLVAYVTRRGQSGLSAEALRVHLKATLPEHMVPSAFVMLDALPLTPSGKLDRRSLPAPDLSCYASREYQAPRGGVEEILAGIWCELLKVERVGRNDNFFELGGHSMLAMKLISRMELLLGAHLPAAAIFRYPTIDRLAKFMSIWQVTTEVSRSDAGQSDREDLAGVGTAKQVSGPLAFTQMQHWNLYRLWEQPTYRFVACVTRVRGLLDLDVFKHGISAVVARHDALRMHLKIRDGVPVQEVTDKGNFIFKMDDLTASAGHKRDMEVIRRTAAVILEPIQITVGPLAAARLLRFGTDDHVLILAADHIISDAASLRIFLRDLRAAYEQYVDVGTCSLPQLQTRFLDHAISQRKEEKSWVGKHGAYWTKAYAGLSRVRFPADRFVPNYVRLGWGIAPIGIGAKLRSELQAWSRGSGTTTALAAFTAYAALVLRWCNARRGIIQYMSDGRENGCVVDTFGYFAAPLFVRVELDRHDSFLTLLERITHEYWNACVNADYSYLESRDSRPDFTRNTVFNWIPRLTGDGESIPPRDPISLEYSQLQFDLPFLNILERDSEPMAVLYDTQGGVSGGVYFPRSRFSLERMLGFAGDFTRFISALVANSECKVALLPISI